jgi:hypothetical protein
MTRLALGITSGYSAETSVLQGRGDMAPSSRPWGAKGRGSLGRMDHKQSEQPEARNGMVASCREDRGNPLIRSRNAGTQ